MTIIKKIGKILEWVVFGCLILFILAVLSPVLPTKRYLRSFIVTSGSMAPSVSAGSLVLVHPTPIGMVRVGDIIAFTLPDDPKTTILHRVNTITTNPLTYHTKGDNNNAADTWSVLAVNVIGTYIYGIPAVGYAATYIRTKQGFALMIGIPVLFLVYSQVRLIIDGIEEEVQKRRKKALGQYPPALEKILHLFIAGLVTASLVMFGMDQIRSLFVAQATICGISISAGTLSPSPTPTPTSTPSPTATPTSTPTESPSPSPTPTPKPSPSFHCPPGNIEISGNGAGSNNSITIICIDETVISQTNLTNVVTNINSAADTGGNSASGNTGGSTTVVSGDSNVTIDVQNSAGSNGQ